MRRWIDSMSLFIASSHPFFFVFHSTTAARPSIAPGSVLRHAAKRAVTDESATATLPPGDVSMIVRVSP